MAGLSAMTTPKSLTAAEQQTARKSKAKDGQSQVCDLFSIPKTITLMIKPQTAALSNMPELDMLNESAPCSESNNRVASDNIC